jgi:adenylosuccinate synthase
VQLLDTRDRVAHLAAGIVDVIERAFGGFEQLTEDTIEFIDEIESVTGARVSLISTGFMRHRGIIDRRQW